MDWEKSVCTGRVGYENRCWVGIDRPVQEGMDMKFFNGLGGNRPAQEGMDMKIVAGLGKIGLLRKGWI